jgi:septal ring factor EnvC (AmiA/AmiB activator)
MCGRKKPRSMIDRKQRGSHDLEVTIYDLKKDIDLLKEDIQAKDIYIKKLEQELDKIAKPIND